MRYDPTKNCFEHHLPEPARQNALFEKAVEFHRRLVDTMWSWSDEAQLTSEGEFVLMDGVGLYQKLFDAYPAGTTCKVEVEDYKDRDPNCKFNAVLRTCVMVPNKWIFAADIFFQVFASVGEDDDPRHDIENAFGLIHLDAVNAGELAKLEAWIDLQGFIAKSAELPLVEREAA